MSNNNYYAPLANAPTGNTPSSPTTTPTNPTPQYLFVIIRELPHSTFQKATSLLYAYHSEATAQSVLMQLIDTNPDLRRQRIPQAANEKYPSWDFRWIVTRNGQFDGGIHIDRVELKD
jgi:hypothetical protein